MNPIPISRGGQARAPEESGFDPPEGFVHVSGPLEAIMSRLLGLAELDVESSTRVAAELCEVPIAKLDDLIRDGVVRPISVRRERLVNVGKVALALVQEGGRP